MSSDDFGNENVIEWISGDKKASLGLSQKRWVNRLKKLAEAHPESVDIYENTDGSIFAYVPLSWIKVSPPRQMTDEQKQKAGERMRKYNQDKGKNNC